MDNVKIVKFTSGQEIIAKVTEDATSIVIESPLTVQPMRNGDSLQVGLLPFSWAGQSPSVSISKEHVLCILEPESGLATQYLAGLAGIALPGESSGPKLTLVE